MSPVVMYDTVTVSTVPPNPPAVAGYVGGHWPTYSELVRRFPHAHHLSIAVTAGEDAECLDIEAGDARPDQAPGWVRRQLARGVHRPALYANRSTMPAVVNALAAAGIHREQVRLWVADWTYSPHIPQGYDACQWTDRALGRNLDESLCLENFFETPHVIPTSPHPTAHPPAPAPKPKIKPHPKVIGATTAGALGIVLTELLRGAGIHIDPQLAGAISTLSAALGGWITPGRK